MATDYDEPRKSDDDHSAEPLQELQSQRSAVRTSMMDPDESDTAEGIDLPGADLSGEELLISVIPAQADEFTCSSCFLVRHRTQIAREKNGQAFCKDCEG